MNHLLGAHVSIAGGLHKAIERGEELSATAIQIFSKNQRQWFAPELKDEEVEKFLESWKNSSIKEIVVHSSYLINLGNPDEKARKRSINSFKNELTRMRKLKLKKFVFHPGSHLGTGEDKGIELITESLKEIIESGYAEGMLLLLETTAGQGSNIGYRFEHLSEIMEKTGYDEFLGVCVDTCHIYSAGYDIKTKKAYESVVKELKKIIGLDKVYAFHINDSKSKFASRVDRHENIGKGEIGEKPFSYILNDKRFYNIPKIIETPGGMEKYKIDLEILRRLIKD